MTGAARLSRMGQALPRVMTVYFGALLVLRLSLSDFLEIDEAQFVGHVDWALVYGNSHPPLYNWLVRLGLELTGGKWPVAVSLVKFPLLAAFYLLTFDTLRRLSEGPVSGLMGVAVLAFMPQIVWMSVITLAHSVLVMAAVAATVHATVIVHQRGTYGAFVWLGLAAAAGTLAKYNYLLFLVPFLLAATTVSGIRQALFIRRAYVSIGVFALLVVAHALAALRALPESTQRMSKLYVSNDKWAGMDVPGLGIDGLFSMVEKSLAWAGPAVLVWAVAWWLARPGDDAAGVGADPSVESFRELLKRTLLIAFGLLAAIILAGDMHKVKERYLTPLLAPLPVWLVLAFPIHTKPAVARTVVVLAGILFLAVGPALAGVTLFGKHRFAYPYADLAQEIRDMGRGPAAILAWRGPEEANLSLALDWPLSRGGEETVALIWSGRSPEVPRQLLDKLAGHYIAAADPVILSAPYRNWSGRSAMIAVQYFVRD